MFVHGQMLRVLSLAALAPSMVIALSSQPAFAQQKVFLASKAAHDQAPQASVDPTKPVQRGYITVNAEPVTGGAKLVVEVFQNAVNSSVVLSLAVAVSTTNAVGGQQAGTISVPIKLLSKGKPDASLYYVKEEFFLDYVELQKMFDTMAPKAGLTIEPGMAMVVKADFAGGHNWGGFDRGGVFFLPPPLDKQGKPMVLAPSASKAIQTPAARPTALDLAFNIPTAMTNIFNDRATGAGLKAGGQIRSRVEGEGKFQINQAEYLHIKKLLIELAADPAKAAQILGPDWSIKFEDRYMKKDAAGQVIKGADGQPIPDPMVDTYYDNDKFDAAKNDMAFRYRWTEGNQTGSWNFKPGIGRSEANGVMYRVEYGVDTTDDKPSTLKAFADSFHPLNPFQIIRDVIPDAKPSEFLKPAVRLEDNRYKFKLHHKNNLEIEISVDDVRAFDLRKDGVPARYFQIEMDIAHLATNSTNVVQNSGALTGIKFEVPNPSYNPAAPTTTYSNTPTTSKTYYNWHDNPEMLEAVKTFLGALGPDAVFDGRPVIHDATDL
ncbi:MAG: CYTH domain-containing protein, partial [Bdellovibrionota bacterium]